MTGGSAEILAYVSVSRFVGTARVLGDGRRVARDFATEMWSQTIVGREVSELGRFSCASEIGLKAVSHWDRPGPTFFFRKWLGRPFIPK